MATYEILGGYKHLRPPPQILQGPACKAPLKLKILGEQRSKPMLVRHLPMGPMPRLAPRYPPLVALVRRIARVAHAL
jgi:hypothetical protein